MSSRAATALVPRASRGTARDLARARIGEAELWLLKPMSYMNRSGDPVRSVATFYKIAPTELLVAYDELDFPAGRGAHEAGRRQPPGTTACADIIAQIGDGFWRLRIGIGHPGDRCTGCSTTCLGRPGPQTRHSSRRLAGGCRRVPVLLNEGAQIAMNRLHGATRRHCAAGRSIKEGL